MSKPEHPQVIKTRRAYAGIEELRDRWTARLIVALVIALAICAGLLMGGAR